MRLSGHFFMRHLAWRLHDHLDYSEFRFFPKLSAVLWCRIALKSGEIR